MKALLWGFDLTMILGLPLWSFLTRRRRRQMHCDARRQAKADLRRIRGW